MWQGRLLEIHTTTAARQPMATQVRATLIFGQGIKGDRYALGTGKYSPFPDIREVTLIEIETIDALARDHGIALHTSQHRRNLTTQDVPLNPSGWQTVLGG
jgi:MOSC domain-containing protein YiiM